MDSSNYREKALAGATGVELILALYDGAIRFLHRALQCIEEEDTQGRRIAIKKAIDVFMYLQGPAATRSRPCPGRRTLGLLRGHVHHDA